MLSSIVSVLWVASAYLLEKNRRQSKSSRAPCLVCIDISISSLAEFWLACADFGCFELDLAKHCNKVGFSLFQLTAKTQTTTAQMSVTIMGAALAHRNTSSRTSEGVFKALDHMLVRGSDCYTVMTISTRPKMRVQSRHANLCFGLQEPCGTKLPRTIGIHSITEVLAKHVVKFCQMLLNRWRAVPLTRKGSQG